LWLQRILCGFEGDWAIRRARRLRGIAIDSTQYVSHIESEIIGFADAKTERLFRQGVCPVQWRALSKALARKLDMLDAAPTLAALRSPPGNRLEALRADRAGQYSIRVNDQWRVCFVWTEAGPERVEVVDYH
jgi:toxin HigB-1